jgi:hypothetical protein
MSTTDYSCFWLVNFLKFFSSETQLPNEKKFGRKHLWKVLYKVSSKQNEKWQVQLTFPEHPSSVPVFSGVCVTRSLVLCVRLVDHCLSFCPFLSLCCPSFDLRILITPFGFGILKLFLRHKPGMTLGAREKVSCSCSTSGTRVNLITNPVIGHEWRKDRCHGILTPMVYWPPVW